MAKADQIAARVRAAIRDVPDFPQPGIIFKDITPVWSDAVLFRDVVAQLASFYKNSSVDIVAGIESRGFIVGAPLAPLLGAGFVPIRKPGKLPSTTRRVDYELEYGSDALEAHIDAVARGQRVLIVDDLLATGGTAAAAARLVRELGGEVVGFSMIVELSFLNGRTKLGGVPFQAIVRY